MSSDCSNTDNVNSTLDNTVAQSLCPEYDIGDYRKMGEYQQLEDENELADGIWNSYADESNIPWIAEIAGSDW